MVSVIYINFNFWDLRSSYFQHKWLCFSLVHYRDWLRYFDDRILFWTDVGRNPHIGRSGMDGSERRVLVNERTL